MLTDEVSEGTDSLFSDAESVVGDVVALFLCTREGGSMARLWEEEENITLQLSFTEWDKR
ncbi:hypothetical protein SuUB63_20090 [Streptococcus uberis]